MAYVESYITLYTIFQNPTEFPTYFLATFKAQIDTIKSHVGQSRYHPKLMQAHFAKICKENSIAVKEATENMELEAKVSSCKEYYMCMLIRIAVNVGYRDIKTTLDN